MSEAPPLSDRDQLQGVDLPISAPVAESTTIAVWNARREPKNRWRPSSLLMKQTSWLSGLAAVRRPSSVASALTADFRSSPIGSETRASWSWPSIDRT